MITKYNTYIKESIDIDSDFLITECVNEFNNDFLNKDILKIRDHVMGLFLYNTICKNILLKFNITTYNIIKIEYPYSDEIIIKKDEINIKELIKDKIVLSYILDMYVYKHKSATLSYKFNLENNTEQLVDYILNNSNLTSKFIILLKDNLLPIDMTNKYKYLIDANNFDLI